MGIALTSEELHAFLSTSHTAVLVTASTDGVGVPVPVWFALKGSLLYVSAPLTSKKIERIRRERKVRFLVEAGDHWRELRGAIITACAEILEHGAEYERAIALLDEKYGAFRLDPASLPEVTRSHYAQQGVIRLAPCGRVVSWDNAKIRLPRPPT